MPPGERFRHPVRYSVMEGNRGVPLYRRGGALTLVHEFLTREERDGLPVSRPTPVIVFAGAGKTALLAELARLLAGNAPCARIDCEDFAGGARELLSLLAFELNRHSGRYGELPFPRLITGLIVIRSVDLKDLDLSDADDAAEFDLAPVLEAPGRDIKQEDPPPLADVLLRRLLRGLPEEQLTDLVTCSAARNLEAAQRLAAKSRLLGQNGGTKARIFSATFWRVRSISPPGGTLALHPVLHRLLLANEGSTEQGWHTDWSQLRQLPASGSASACIARRCAPSGSVGAMQR